MDVMNIVTSRILMQGVRFYAYHGVLPQENIVGHYYLVDLEMDVDCSSAMLSDDLNDTVSYADVYEILKSEMAVPSKLLEHVVCRISKSIFAKYDTVKKVKIRLMKQNPPMGTDGASAGVEAEFVND